MANRTGKPYKDGELEVILSLAPTKDNIRWLSILLERSEEAIEIVYKIAFEHGPFGENADIQERKIIDAKERVGISIGRRKSRA
ncbi:MULTISPECIES: hypothetical protein [Geobacter]|uniref:Uncharacterized protein n=1 Tax=Geobacter benzoatilyticus TaxID=2815309 RepID=A0ABX7Q2Z2_9BACT|nr:MULTISPECIES: hypothetical protein [Geobacter]MBT1077181.1 hypothetical protein [Geobacter grbiciae]QSV45470.1 hypothetical protein JZM60_15330 [Geobacter benzoatilyticus]